MGANILPIIAIIISVVVAVCVYKTFKENKKLAYLQFYEIIKRHHNEEITELRRTVLNDLEVRGEWALAKNKTLKDLDNDYHLKVSALANYYEGLGMFLEGGWKIFPEEARRLMLEMLHNSVSKSWPLIDKYKDIIYPEENKRPPDWAHSYGWLYERVMEFRREKYYI